MRSLPLLLLGLLALVLSGCVVAGITALGAGIVYVSGEARQSYAATVDQTHQAVLTAMDEMGLIKLEETHQGADWRIRTRRPTDAADVKIRIRRGGESLTEVSVRVGLWGDKEYSTQLLEAVGKNLP